MKKILLLLIFIPSLVYSQPNCIKLVHGGYTSIYDTINHYPAMVTWLDTKSRLECTDKLKRKDNFAPDPKCPTKTNLQSSYDAINKGHKLRGIPGVDRGHMCPAADNQCNKVDINECFYFSNMAPQYHRLNAGNWKTVEVMTRELSINYDSVYVWCGSIGSSEKVNGVSIPSKCWKVMYVVRTNTWYAFIFDNDPTVLQGIDKWKVSPSDITKLTGFKFER
jgi:hypothetical protein